MYDINIKLSKDQKPSLILYRYRWVVLFSYFLSSSAVGAVLGSLGTNRGIFDKASSSMEIWTLDISKYSDLIMFLPMNFLSIWITENKGLKPCINVGCFIMIVGNVLRLLGGIFSLWLWFVGHIVCISSASFLKNPVTKLASNWFGDKERGVATAIGIVSTPFGYFLSNILILVMFKEGDKIPEGEPGGFP